MRLFNGKELEILCPAGNAEIFSRLLESKADAFYFGGKKLNMRMHRKNFNFTNTELIKAVKMAHLADKKTYITINNLIDENSINETIEFLSFLSDVKPDGIIIQDMAVLDLAQKYAKNITLHASVMANVASFYDVKKMEELSVKRVIVSREVPLDKIEEWSKKTSIEFEYFVHGDMCVCHGSRCYYSGILLNQSSNQGRCMKPCRWQYKAIYKGFEYSAYYPLAVKDMYMYRHLPEMIKSGIMSFKIEGRMRSTDYIKNIVDLYAGSLDRYIENPKNYNREIGHDKLYEGRMRDFSTAYAFGDLGEDNFNERYEGTGYFYSTGKVFSKPTSEIKVDNMRISDARKALKVKHKKHNTVMLAVKVDTIGAAKVCIKNNVDIIYLSANAFNKEGFSKEEIIDICEVKGKSKIILCTPQTCFDDIFDEFMDKVCHEEVLENIDGFLVTTLGVLDVLKNKNKNIYGDYMLNIFNSLAARKYKEFGLKQACLSNEISKKELKNFLGNTDSSCELIVHGSPTVMQFESDIFKNLEGKDKVKIDKSSDYSDDTLILVDDIDGRHPVKKDEWERGHMLMGMDICLMPVLDRILNLGIKTIRLEIQYFELDWLEEVIKYYQEAIKTPEQCREIFNKIENKKGFTLGALNY